MLFALRRRVWAAQIASRGRQHTSKLGVLRSQHADSGSESRCSQGRRAHSRSSSSSWRSRSCSRIPTRRWGRRWWKWRNWRRWLGLGRGAGRLRPPLRPQLRSRSADARPRPSVAASAVAAAAVAVALRRCCVSWVRLVSGARRRRSRSLRRRRAPGSATPLLPPPPSLATLTPLRGCCCPSSWRCAWLSSPTSTLPHPRLHARAGVRLALQPLHARGETGCPGGRGERWCVHPAGGVRGGGAGRADDAPARLPHHLGGGAAKHARAHPREAACSKCRLAWCHSSPCQPPRAVMRVGPGPLSTLSRSQRATQLARRGFDAAAKAAARSLILHF